MRNNNNLSSRDIHHGKQNSHFNNSFTSNLNRLCKPIAFMYGRSFNSKSEKKRFERFANEMLHQRQGRQQHKSSHLYDMDLLDSEVKREDLVPSSRYSSPYREESNQPIGCSVVEKARLTHGGSKTAIGGGRRMGSATHCSTLLKRDTSLEDHNARMDTILSNTKVNGTLVTFSGLLEQHKMP